MLTKLGATTLGDRWSGALRVEGNSLLIGRDEGQFAGTVKNTSIEWNLCCA